MAEDIVGQLQEIGVRGHHADLAALLAGVHVRHLLELPAVVEPCHGILLRQGLQNGLLLLVQEPLALQGADCVLEPQVPAAQLGELACQEGQQVQDMLELHPGDGGDCPHMRQEFLLVQLQDAGIGAVFLLLRHVLRQAHLPYQNAGQMLALHDNRDAGVGEPGGLAVADIWFFVIVGA